MTLHVNSAHLEYLTPEREDVAFLEDDTSEFDSIWQLEKGAKEGLTNGVDESPTQPKTLNCIHSKKPATNPMDSPMSTSTEISEVGSMSSPAHSSIGYVIDTERNEISRFDLCAQSVSALRTALV